MMSPGGSGQYPSCTFSSTLAGEYVPTALGLGWNSLSLLDFTLT